MDSPISLMDYEDELDTSDPTIELPNIWEPMVYLHKKLLTAIPKKNRSIWSAKVEDFYYTYFRNLKPKEDSLSTAVDEIIEEINATDNEEVINEPKSLNSTKRKPRRTPRKKKTHRQLIEEMKNILVVGNKSIGLVALKFLENLEEAKETITLINNEMEYHKKQTIKYALKAGECLLRIQELCQIEKKKFYLFLKECNIK